MLRAKGFAIGLVIGIGVTLAVTAPWKATLAQGDRIYTKPGDVDGDGSLTIGDAVFLLNYLFASGPEPAACPAVGGMLPATGQETCYNSAGEVIDCASADFPGQDGFYRAGCPKEGRFVDNGDGTVSDQCTGLMWQKETAPGEYSWQEALKYCEGLSLAGHSDWRLPNILELRSIVDYGRWNPGIDPVFQSMSDWYWSSSTHAGWPDCAWGADFSGGDDNDEFKGLSDYVRPVRGGLSQ